MCFDGIGWQPPFSLLEDLLSFINCFWSISYQKWMYCKIFFWNFFFLIFFALISGIHICEIHHHDVGSSHAHLSSLSSFFLLDKIETFKQFYLESKTADLLTEYIQKWGQKDQLSKRSVDHKISYQKICLLKVQFTKRSEDQKIGCPKDQFNKRSVDQKIS